MRKAVWSTAALVVFLSGAGAVLGGAAVQAADPSVALGSSDEPLKFLPAEITVSVGQKVVWHNDTDLQHDVHADDGSFGTKNLLSKGEKFEFTFTKAGDYSYYCAPHKDAGMKGLVRVSAGGATATTAPSSTTTTATTAATTPAGDGSTTTTTAKAAAGESTTTTAASAGAATTPTTAPPSVTPSSAPDSAGVTSTTIAQGEQAAADGHADDESESRKDKDDEDSSPIGIAFAGVSTLLLAAISGKLLSSKS